jgi:hypothetical protein
VTAWLASPETNTPLLDGLSALEGNQMARGKRKKQAEKREEWEAKRTQCWDDFKQELAAL